MKKNLLFMMGVVALLLTGCSTETGNVEDTSKITRISVDATEGSVDAKTRTATNGTLVTWVTNDEIGLLNAADRANYKHFRLSSAPGTNTGYFDGVTADDYLTSGTTYKVVYPYSALEYTGTSNRYRKDIQVFSQTDNSNSNLANDDWLTSESRTIVDGTMPAFRLKHCFALLKVTLAVEGIIEDDDYEMYFANFTISTANNEKAFANKVYIDDKGDLGVYSYINSIIAARTDKPWLENGIYTFWYVVKTDPQVGIVPLQLQPYFSQGASGTVLWSLNTTFTPSAVLEAGKLYNINLKMTYNNGSYSASALEVIGH